MNEIPSPEVAMRPDQLPPAIDAGVIAELRALVSDGTDILVELRAAFVEDGRERVKKMQVAVATGDLVAFRRAAHSLKGMSGSIGAHYLSTLTTECEQAELEAVTADQVESIEREFERVSVALDAA